MTDKKDDIDLAKEIEELDSFLDEQEESIPLDFDDEEDAKPVFESTIKNAKKQGKKSVKKDKPKKAGGGKLLGYFIFLFILFGGAYAAVVYAPQFIKGSQFDKVKEFVSGNSEGVMQNALDTFKSYVPIAEKETSEPTAPAVDMTDLSMPMNDSALIDASEALPVPSDMEPKTDAMDDVTPNDDGLDDLANEVDAILADLEGLTAEPPEPINAPTSQDITDLEPLEPAVIDQAQDVRDMPADELINMVEEQPAEPAMPVTEVATKKAVPVAPIITQKKQAPSKPKAAPAPTKTQDARLGEARALLKSKQYQKALDLYSAILADNPADTGALTGRQLAETQLRMGGGVAKPRPQTQSRQAAPVAVSGTATAVDTLLGQAQANPNDANLAVKIARAYEGAGDKQSALNWYRKALQIDVLHGGGLDRMAIYDAMADLNI